MHTLAAATIYRRWSETLLCSQTVKSTLSVHSFGPVRAFVPSLLGPPRERLVAHRPGGRAHVV